MSNEIRPLLLLVDDDETFRQVLQRAMQRRGFDSFGFTLEATLVAVFLGMTIRLHLG